MKQYKALSPETAAMFFSVDTEANKILCMSSAPKVWSSLRVDNCQFNIHVCEFRIFKQLILNCNEAWVPHF